MAWICIGNLMPLDEWCKRVSRASHCEAARKGSMQGEVSALLGDLKSRWIVVEVWDGLHREIRKLALLDDLRIYEWLMRLLRSF
jgi:hypothetical protein